MKLFKCLFIVSLIPFLYGCKQSMITELNYQNNNYTIATADSNYTLSLVDVYDRLYKSNYLASGGVLDTNSIRSFVDSIIVDTLNGLEALSIDVAEHYNEYRIFKLRYYDFILREYLNKMVYEKVENIDSLEIVAFYNSRPDLFSIDEQVDLYHIALTKNILLNGSDSLRMRKLEPGQLDSLMKLYADSIYSLIPSKEQFPEIAKIHSEDVITANTGGHIGWTKKNVHPHPFDSVAFSLEVGEIARPYSDRSGWHIIMIDGYYPEGLPELNENLYIAAERTMKTMQTNEIGQNLIDSLFETIEVQINEDLADKDYYVVEGKTWAAIVNGVDTIDVNEARSMELTFRTKYNVKNSSAEMKVAMMRTIAEKYVIVQAARNIGLENEPQVIAKKETLWHKYARTILKNAQVDVRWEPSDSLVLAYYNNHIEDFEVEQPLKVQHIIVEDSTFGEFLRDQALAGVDFLELAQEYYPGEEAIRRELADLGFVGPQDVSQVFFETAQQTRIGEVSHPVKTEFGYHIIKVLEIKEKQDYSKARRPIIQKLKKEYFETNKADIKNMLFEKYHVSFTNELKELHLKPKELRQN